MHFFYIDPGLRDDLGHHANSCRLITRELAALGIGFSVHAHASVVPALQQELGARPVFSQLTYWSTDHDPISGWLTSFLHSAAATHHDMSRVPRPARDDFVYLNSAQAPQFMALLGWAQGVPAAQRPHLAVEFGTGPGLDFEREAKGLRIRTRDPRQDPRAVLYRHAATLLPKLEAARVNLFTFEEMSSHLYGFLLKAPVRALPLPQCAAGPIVLRGGRRPPTVSVLGHQRPDKGYALVPEILRILLDRRPDVRLLVHNGAPGEMAEVQQAVRNLIPGHPMLTVDERLAGPALWQELLQRSDIILCPYPVWRFASAYSAVAAEAVANAIPMVVPAGTTLSALLDRFGGGGTRFEGAAPAAIAEATIRAIDEFEALGARAISAAVKWGKTMGPANMVRALIEAAYPEFAQGADRP